MNIDQTRELLYDYVRGKLSSSERHLVEEELNHSKIVRDELKKVQLYYAAIESVEPVALPENFLENIHKRIDSGKKKTLFDRLLFPLPVEIAGVVATVALVVFLFFPQLKMKKNDAYKLDIPSQKSVTAPVENPVEEKDKREQIREQDELSVAMQQGMDKRPRALRAPAPKSAAIPDAGKKDIHETIPPQRSQQPVSSERKSLPRTEQKKSTMSPNISAPAPESQQLQSDGGSEANDVKPPEPLRRMATADQEYNERQRQIVEKIRKLESKRARMKASPPATYRGESSEAHIPDEDLLSANQDITALLIHCRMKWRVIDSTLHVKTYSADGTVKSAELFLKKIKGKSNIQLLRTIPENYESAIDSVEVEFKVFER